MRLCVMTSLTFSTTILFYDRIVGSYVGSYLRQLLSWIFPGISGRLLGIVRSDFVLFSSRSPPSTQITISKPQAKYHCQALLVKILLIQTFMIYNVFVSTILKRWQNHPERLNKIWSKVWVLCTCVCMAR